MEKIKPRTAISKFLENIPEDFQTASLKINSENNNKFSESIIFELPSGKKIKFLPKIIDSAKCKVWTGNARMQQFLNSSSTIELIESIKNNGQLVPALARPLKNDNKFTHEIIYGSRRLLACSHLGIGIKILEVPMEDQDAILFMDVENSKRQDLSPYEMARSYSQWIEQGIFKSQVELSKKLGLERAWLNKIISLNKIPLEIIIALSEPKYIKIKEGLKLLEVLKKITSAEVVQCIHALKSQNVNQKEIIFHTINNFNNSNFISKSKPVAKTLTGDKYSVKIYNTSPNTVSLKFDRSISPSNLSIILKDIENIIKHHI